MNSELHLHWRDRIRSNCVMILRLHLAWQFISILFKPIPEQNTYTTHTQFSLCHILINRIFESIFHIYLQIYMRNQHMNHIQSHHIMTKLYKANNNSEIPVSTLTNQMKNGMAKRSFFFRIDLNSLFNKLKWNQNYNDHQLANLYLYE